MTLKLLATGIAAAAIVGSCAAGVTALTSASGVPIGSPAVQLTHAWSPLAPLPAPNMVDLITELFVVAMRNDKEMPTCS